MRGTITLLIYTLFLYSLIQSCASPSSINGGPRDTIPPLLIESFPLNNTINYKSNEITLVFNERIKADQLKSKLLITPLTENDFKFKVNKEILTITFNQQFEDSTTYILNFADGVQDITESNPAINLRIAFSTGTFIDSAKISGNVKELLKNEAREGNIVSLYKIDTNSVFKNKPLYFTYTDKYGTYKLENLKPDQYRIYSFKDENKNLILESSTEEFGFLADTLKLINILDSINIKTVKIDASPFKTIRNGISGKYYEIKYSKPISIYEIQNIDSTTSVEINSSLTSDKSGIRLYPPTDKIDSIPLRLITKDTVNNIQIDTIMVKFQPSTRKNDPFEINVYPKQKEMVIDTMTIKIIANKPINKVDKQLIFIELDSKKRIKADSLLDIKTKNHSTEIDITMPILSEYIKQLKKDTLEIMANSNLPQEDSIKYQEEIKKIEAIKIDDYKIIIGQAALISIEADSSKESSINFFEPDATSYGTVSGTITGPSNQYTLELIDKSFNVIKSITSSEKTYKLKFIKPGTYSLRIKYTEDENTWNVGNILQNKPPGKVYFFNKYFDIRANWDLENVNISY